MNEEYLWQYVMSVEPFAKKEDIEELKEIDEFDLLIIFKNGRRVVIDRETGYYKNIIHNNINELTEEQDKIEFAYRLRRLMRYKHINQERLAEMAGLTQTMISRYVSGKAIPSVIVARQIAKALNCSIDDFFDRDY